MDDVLWRRHADTELKRRGVKEVAGVIAPDHEGRPRSAVRVRFESGVEVTLFYNGEKERPREE